MSTTERLREYLGRLLGWTKTSAIDHALRSIEFAREHRAQLVLCGQGDLVPLAHGLHRRAFGANTPFMVCDPRRSNTPTTVRSPHDSSSPMARLRDKHNVQYICLDEDSLQWLARPGPIEVPPMAERAGELPRVVDEYVFDALVELAPTSRALVLCERDRQWLIEQATGMSLADIESATARLVALRSSTNLAQAPAGPGGAAVSLHRWMGLASCQHSRAQLALPDHQDPRT